MADGIYGALDIGSNTVKTLAAQVSGNRLRVLAVYCTATRLGGGKRGGCLSPAATERTARAAAEQIAALRAAFGPVPVAAAATSAVRDADNGTEFAAFCAKVCGMTAPPMIISGEEEAELTFLGASSRFPAGGWVVNCDPGGGSTEISCGISGEKPCFTASVNVGCVRWLEKYGPCNEGEEEAEEIFRPLAVRVRETAPECRSLSISGGTAYTAASLCAGRLLELGIDAESISAAQIAQLRKELGAKSLEEKKLMPGMPEGRAEVALAGMTILSALMKAFDTREFTPNQSGLGAGLVKALSLGRIRSVF